MQCIVLLPIDTTHCWPCYVRNRWWHKDGILQGCSKEHKHVCILSEEQGRNTRTCLLSNHCWGATCLGWHCVSQHQHKHCWVMDDEPIQHVWSRDYEGDAFWKMAWHWSMPKAEWVLDRKEENRGRMWSNTEIPPGMGCLDPQHESANWQGWSASNHGWDIMAKLKLCWYPRSSARKEDW